MGVLANIKGERFGRLVALEIVGRENRVMVWRCQCDCGKTRDVAVVRLRSGKTRSCGCLRGLTREQEIARF